MEVGAVDWEPDYGKRRIAGRFELQELVAVWRNGGWHCPKCGEPCSYIGHRTCTKSVRTDSGTKP